LPLLLLSPLSLLWLMLLLLPALLAAFPLPLSNHPQSRPALAA
jgi:hypothetical protein